MYNESVQFVVKNYLRFPRTDLLPREVNNAEVRSIFLSNHTLRFSSPGSPSCVYERGRLTSGLYNNGCACAKVYSIIFLLIRFYFLGHVFGKCKISISLIKISLSTLCFANIEHLTSFPFTSGSESIRITFLCFPL